jgi:hypothetical protein
VIWRKDKINNKIRENVYLAGKSIAPVVEANAITTFPMA